MMALLQLVLVLCALWRPSAPAALPAHAINGTSPAASATVSDSHVRQERSVLTNYGGSVGLSPYFADLQGRPSPTPPTLTTELTPAPPKCMDEETCNPLARYRTISGRCNNLQSPHHGTPGQAMHTLLPQRYDSPAVFRMRAVGGGLLPNPRHVSLLMSLAPEGAKVEGNSLFVQMGQFIDHDFSITTTVREMTPGGKSVEVDCRACSSWHNPACAPIPVPLNDPYQPPHLPTGERRCLPMTRSVGYLVKDSQGRPMLSQPNFNTAFLDMSPVYGSSRCTAEDLRLHRDGMLESDEKHMLTKRPADDFPLCFTEAGYCLHSGDKRVNENVGLTMMHTLLHRAHNHLAEGLKVVNPHWSDERLYQEARRINIAQYQNFVYGEYVPLLLGYHTAAKMQLIPNHEGYFLGYDPTIDPGVYNEFSTAAFRMGHSQVPKHITFMNDKYEVTYHIPLHYAFFNSTMLALGDVFDPLVRGLLGVSMRPTDLKLVDSLGNKLFMEEGDRYSGHDLFALNVARGRDHGLAPYVEYLKMCGVKQVSSFADLESVMRPERLALLARAYEDVRDIDLYPGGLAEVPLPGSLVGPTFSCIIARQFLSLKIGDRFWFESPAAGFTHAQLQSIRRVTLASVICGVLDQRNQRIPVHAFQTPHPQSNPERRCSEFLTVDLELWRETPHSPSPPCTHQGQSYQEGALVPVSPCLACVCQPGGKMRCQCDLSGCKQTQAAEDCYCRRICGYFTPHLKPQYRQ